MAYCSQGNHTKFGNRMNYIKEKTEPYHISTVSYTHLTLPTILLV